MSSTFQEGDYIWKNGDLVPWADAQIHVMSTAVQFGTSVFEGIRAYETPDGPAIFRLDAHVRRLMDSCRIYRMTPGYTADEITAACVDTVRKNGLGASYVRPMVLRGYGSAGLDPTNSPIDVYIPNFPWGAYLGEEALANGVDVCVSSWQRAQPNTYPILAKAAGHYTASQLIKMEAVLNGFSEGIALGPGGLVSEGSGQNLFLVRDGILITPMIDGTSLSGITRHSVLHIARSMGIEVREQLVPREMLYACEEMFFTGTASEVTPIRSVDHIPVGAGKAGPTTLDIQRRFLDIAGGRVPDEWGWLTRVE